MPIDLPIPQDTRSRLAEWLELETLVRPRGVATRSDVRRLCDFIEDDGHEEDVAVANAYRFERGFGIVVGRLRIAEAAAARLAEAHDGASDSTLSSLEA